MRRHGWAAIPAWLGHVRGCSCLLVCDPGPLLTAGAWAVVSHSAGAALLSGQTQGTWQSVCLSIYPSGHATWRGVAQRCCPAGCCCRGGSGICHRPRELCLVLGAESSTPRQVCRQQAMDQGHVSRTTGFRACSVASLSQGTGGSSFHLRLCFGAGLQQEIAAAVFQRCMT